MSRRASCAVLAFSVVTPMWSCASESAHAPLTADPPAGKNTPPVDSDAGPYQALGLNDVTILAPLPATAATTVVLRASEPDADGNPILPEALFNRVLDVDGAQPMVSSGTYPQTQLLAVRFDPCHRTMPAPCSPELEGRVRLVFQPVRDSHGADDVGLHAFYTVPAAEIAGAVAGLRELAAIARTPTTSALAVSSALTGPSAESYRAALVAWLKQHARSDRLVQLTFNAQPLFFAQVRWLLGGIEKKDGAFVEIAMVGAAGTREGVVLSPDASFEVDPVETAPTGLTPALSAQSFAALSSFELLAAIDNPTKHGTDSVSCVGCHVSTVITHTRAAAMGIDPSTIAGRFTSKHDLSVAGGESATTQASIRALGWKDKVPLVSQRVVNESALVLDEIEQRFPR